MAIFFITYFYCHFENVQPNWLDRSSWNFQDRQRGGFEGCSENFVPIWHLWPILQADKGWKWQQKYVIRIFIATLKMYSQTGWTDQSEIFRIVKGVDLRAVQKISSRSDTYGRIKRTIKAENIFSLHLTIGVRSGRNFVYSPQIHPFDDPESFSSIGLASLAVHFQSGNKNMY